MNARLLALALFASLPAFAAQPQPASAQTAESTPAGYQSGTFVGFSSATTGANCSGAYNTANCYDIHTKQWIVESAGYRYTLQNPNEPPDTALSRAFGGARRFSLNNMTPGTPLEVRASNRNLYILEHKKDGGTKEHSYKIVAAQPAGSR